MHVRSEIESRISRIPPLPDLGKKGNGSALAFGVAAIVGAFLVLSYGVKHSRIQSAAALSDFPMGFSRASEADRVFSRDWPSFNIAKAIALTVPSQDRTLVFRQAEVGFYTRSKFIYFFDPSIAKVFERPDAASAARILLDLGVRWIATPDYGMSELNNSAIGDLVGSPRFSELVLDSKGFKLYRLRHNEVALTPVVVGEEQFSANAKIDPSSWIGMATIGGTRRPQELYIGADGWLRFKPGMFRVFQAMPTLELMGDPAARVNGGTFVAGPGPVQINALIGGRGKIEVVAQTVDSVAEGAASELETTAPREFLVWRGVLVDGQRPVTGQFADHDATGLTKYRILVRFIGAGEFRFGGWRALSYPTSVTVKAAPEVGGLPLTTEELEGNPG